MKKTIIVALFLTSAFAFAQMGRVGINTESPKTTMDVSGTIGTDGKSLATDITGLQAPRLTRDELTSKGDALYGADQKGALIYVTDVTGGNNSLQRVNVIKIGYYYFDGAVWQYIGPVDVSVPVPAYFRLSPGISNFLSGQNTGQQTRIFNLNLIKNAIQGLSYNNATSTITFPPGTYQITFVYEAVHNAPGCTLSSYFVDFPEGTSGTQRVHSTASHNEGGTSNHGGNITYTTTFTGSRNWQVQLGRGQSGNCSGGGMNLIGNSTHLLIFRMGD